MPHAFTEPAFVKNNNLYLAEWSKKINIPICFAILNTENEIQQCCKLTETCPRNAVQPLPIKEI